MELSNFKKRPCSIRVNGENSIVEALATYIVAHLLDDFTHVGVNGEHKCLVFDVMGERLDEISFRFDRRKIQSGWSSRLADRFCWA